MSQELSSSGSVGNLDLLVAFRTHYERFERAVGDVLLSPTDPTVLARLGDDLDEFAALANEVSIW